MRKVTGAILPPTSLRTWRDRHQVFTWTIMSAWKLSPSLSTYQLQKSYMITSVIGTFKIPVRAPILAELLKIRVQTCYAPCSAYTLLSTTTSSFWNRNFFSFIWKLYQHSKNEEQFDEGTGQDRSGYKKVPQGTNPFHTISYNEASW